MATLQISAYGMTHTKKERNGDNIYINGDFLRNAHDPQNKFESVNSGNIQVYAVADAGAMTRGYDAAGRASELVMSMVHALQDDMQGLNKVEKGKIWDYLSLANDKVVSRAHQNDADMGVSFSGLFFQGNHVMAAHIGDTRIYCIRNNAIIQLTKDNLAITELLDRGVISREKMDSHKQSSTVSAYLGMENLTEVSDKLFTKPYFVEPGDMFLLCSDGISDTFSENEMEDLVKGMAGLSNKDIVELMAKRADERNDDDFTMLFLTIDAIGDESRTEEPVIRKKSYETKPQEEQASYTANEETMDDLGDTKPMEPIKDNYTPTEDEPQEVAAVPVETQVQFDPRAFSVGLENYRDDLSEPSEEDEEEEEEPSNNARKYFGAIIAVGLMVVLVIIGCLIVKLVSDSKKEEESSKPTPVVESVDSDVESESESAADSEWESESEVESKVESESESEVESEPESEPVSEIIEIYTVQSGDSWWGLCNKYYGATAGYCKDKYYDAIKKYNDIEGKALIPGMQIKFPTLEVLKKLAGDAQ